MSVLFDDQKPWEQESQGFFVCPRLSRRGGIEPVRPVGPLRSLIRCREPNSAKPQSEIGLF